MSRPRRNKTHVEVWSDGSYGPLGHGGWAAIVMVPWRVETRRLLYGAAEPETDALTMEAEAAAAGIREAGRMTRLPILVRTDCRTLIHLMQDSGAKHPAKAIVGAAADRLDVSWKWVRAHNGHVLNEQAHSWATLARKKAERAFDPSGT
jgi:ribonuclease HI